MNVLSLFDGISCGQLALNRVGIKYEKYFASEIDKIAIEITQHHFPNTIQLGDIRNINIEKLPKIDLILAGSPCQSFSLIGKQLNFIDDRGKLFFNFLDILNYINPKFFLLENVIMANKYKENISNLLQTSPILINSNTVSAQNRKRLYWTNIPIEYLHSKYIYIEDILEDCVDSKYNLNQKIIEKYRLEKYKHLKNTNFTLVRTEEGKKERQLYNKIYQKDYSSWKLKELIPRKDKKVNCITTFLTNQHFIIDSKNVFRTLTALECERLQNLPENYTNIKNVSNKNRIKCIGNGWTVDVISHILKGIL